MSDRLESIGKALGVTPVRSFEHDDLDKCWSLHGGPSLQHLESTVTVHFWSRASLQIDASRSGGSMNGSMIYHGPGIPGLDEVVDRQQAINLIFDTVVRR